MYYIKDLLNHFCDRIILQKLILRNYFKNKQLRLNLNGGGQNFG